MANSLQHGESLYNLDGRIGGDTMLSARGEMYAKKLSELVRESVGVRTLRLSCVTVDSVLTFIRMTAH